LNSVQPSQSCFCLWRHDLQTESTVVHAVELSSVEFSWVELCRYKHLFRRVIPLRSCGNPLCYFTTCVFWFLGERYYVTFALWHDPSVFRLSSNRDFLAHVTFLIAPYKCSYLRRSRTVWRQQKNAIPTDIYGLWYIWLYHALIFNRVDYCNSILHRVAVVDLRPFQSVLNAACRKQKFDLLRRLCVTTLLLLLLLNEAD